MNCPACHAENREGRRFCAACAAPLALACAGCGFVNEPGERFCGGCGAEVGPRPATAGAPAAAAAPARSAGERRLVTILFADLAGYTRLSSTLDPEETNAVLERFFDTVDGVVLEFGGAIDKHIGDNVMAIFGAPVAHDNDPERAVRAAIEIHRKVDALVGLPVPLRVHIGLATGEVVASALGSQHHQEYTVTGDAVNLAARLQDKAVAGETMVSEVVRRATEGIALYEAVGELPIKGLAAPVPVAKLLGLRAERVAPRERGFVGRRAELRQLEAVLEECVDGGRGAVLQVRGEAGIGKTRLVAETCDHASALGIACHTVLVLDFGVGRGHGVAATIAEALASDAAVAAIAADERPFLADLLGATPDDAHRASYAAMSDDRRDVGRRRVLADLLRAAAAARPLMLVIEDVHWADRAGLLVVASLAEAALGCRAVVLMTSRIDGDPIDRAWRTDAYRGPLLVLELAPLRGDEARALAAEVFAAADDIVLGCLERAGGNPLFLEQLLEHARESAGAGVPATVQSLVLSRMDRLPADARRALQAAAVLGQRFTTEAVRALLGDAGWQPDSLVAHHLIRHTDEGWLFHHALIRDGVYSSLTRAPRAALHRAAAAWFAARDPMLHATHLELADDPTAALAFAGAAEAEAEALRLDRAIALAGRGLALARARVDRHRLGALRGELARRAGEGAICVEAWAVAVETAADDPARCRAWIGVAAGHRLLSAFAPAFAALDVAEPLAVAAQLERERGWIHYHRGSVLFALGDQGAARRAHDLALAAARRAHDRELEARAISGQADSDFASGEMAPAADGYRRCIALCAELGLERYALPNRLMDAQIIFWFGGVDEALAMWTETLAVAARLGDKHAAILGDTQVAYALLHAGRLEPALVHAERAVARAVQLGARRYQTQAQTVRAEILAVAGRRAEALAAIEDAVALARTHGMGFIGAAACGNLAWLAPDPAVRAAAEAEGAAALSRGSLALTYIMFHRAILEGLLERGAWDQVEPHAAAIEAWARPEASAYPWWAARARVLAAWGRGDRDPALATAIRAVLARARAMHGDPRLPDDVLAFAARDVAP